MPVETIQGIKLTDTITEEDRRVTFGGDGPNGGQVPNTFSRILRLEPATNEYLYIPNGNYFLMKFISQPNAPNQIPMHSQIRLVKVNPNGVPTVLAETGYDNHYVATWSQQNKPERKDALSIAFEDPDLDVVVIPPKYYFEIHVNSTEEINEAHADTHVLFKVGKEVEM